MMRNYAATGKNKVPSASANAAIAKKKHAGYGRLLKELASVKREKQEMEDKIIICESHLRFTTQQASTFEVCDR